MTDIFPDYRVNTTGRTVHCTSSTRPTGVDGLWIYESDTGRILFHDGTGWTIYSEPTQDWTPTLQGATEGFGFWTAWYRRERGFVEFEALFRFGSGSSMTSFGGISAPVSLDTTVALGTTDDIVAHVEDVSVPRDYPLHSRIASSTVISLATWSMGASYLGIAGVNATQPMTWATGDGLYVAGRARMATRYT